LGGSALAAIKELRARFEWRYPRLAGAPGINIFGDWAATTGLAQAARRLAVALADAGFDLSLGTIRSGAPRDMRRVPDVLRHVREGRSHVVDLWMVNVNEFPVITDDLLRPPGKRTYSIGVWYWELTSFPEHLLPQIGRVDEIWVATAFVKASFEKVTSCPVRIVPAIVPELRGAGNGRGDFGLSDSEVVFLFSLDVNSMIARKNPAGVIEAFALAFDAEARTRNRLVIKVLNLGLNPAFASWLEEAVAGVGGVLVDKDLREDELVDLFSCCDVYVSLHRSEGFGFGLAEAMSLGKPVISTAYSGNLEFTTNSNSCQVGYRLREITDADHAYDEGARAVYQPGAVWADPDVGEAAKWMQLLSADSELRRRLGEAGRETVLERNSPAAAVAAVRRNLQEIRARVF
jgi:glycosyltransferase involved in cell wall biosynthesis